MKSKNPWYINRGGFQSPFNPRRAPKVPDVYDLRTGQKLKPLDAVDTAMRSSESKLRNQERDNSGSGVGKKGGGFLTIAVGSSLMGLANHGKERLAGAVQQSKRKMSEDSMVHIIRFHVGRRSTSSVRQAANLYGSNNLQISNSLSEVRKPEDRKSLSKSFGFNQKSIDFLSAPFFISVRDYLNLYQIMEWNVPPYGRRVAYGLAQQEYSNIRIRNSNSYHKIKFKVHVVKILDDDVTSQMLFDKTFNKSPSSQDLGTIPKVYQITEKPKVDNYVNSMLTYRGCSPAMSANFKTQAKIVKTFSKTLSPGDTLDFRMTHHLGPGIRLDVARAYMTTSRKGLQPSGYFPIIEAEGTPCEGQELETGSIYQGSCPGWYNYEYTTGIKAVKHNSIVSDTSMFSEDDPELDDSELKDGKISSEYAVKIYEREFLTKPPISFSADEIGDPSDQNKKFSVFSTSDERVVYSKSMYKPTKKTILNEDFDEFEEDEFEDENLGDELEIEEDDD